MSHDGELVDAEPNDERPVISDYVSDLPASRYATRRRTARVTIAVVGGLALMGPIYLVTMGGNRRDGTETGSSTTVAMTALSVPRPDARINPGAPRDGKATRRLPVRVTPSRDLVDGQIVGVHGSGFRPLAEVGIVLCTNDAQWRGSAACDLFGAALSQADANGEVWGFAKIRATLTIAGQPIDCTAGNVDPDEWALAVEANDNRTPDYPSTAFSCGIVIGEMHDYDNSGGWPIAFEGATFVTVMPGSASVTSPEIEPDTTATISTTTTERTTASAGSPTTSATAPTLPAPTPVSPTSPIAPTTTSTQTPPGSTGPAPPNR